MKLAVLGAGAIGSMLGGLVRHHSPDTDVLLLARGEQGRALREQGGVLLEGPWGSYEVRVPVADDVRELAGADFVLLTVKSQATEEAIRAAAPYLGDAVVVSIQNGLNSPTLSRFVDPARLVMGMTATNMAVMKPGSVSLQLDGATILGPPPGQEMTPAVRDAVELLRKSRLRVDPHPNVLGVQCNKLAINSLGAASALSASNFITEAVLHKPWRRTVGLPILDECVAAFERNQIKLARIPGVPDVYGFRRVLRTLDMPLAGAALAVGARWLFNRKPIVFSLYQDLRRGKPTEVDYINGEIVRLARQAGFDAVCNAQVVELVHELEHRGDTTFYSREEVIQRFEQLRPANDWRSGVTVERQAKSA